MRVGSGPVSSSNSLGRVLDIVGVLTDGVVAPLLEESIASPAVAASGVGVYMNVVSTDQLGLLVLRERCPPAGCSPAVSQSAV